MFVLACRETGLDCDFVVRGNTRKEFLKNGADHFINQHGMDAKEIYWDEIPVNFLCQSFSKVNVGRAPMYLQYVNEVQEGKVVKPYSTTHISSIC